MPTLNLESFLKAKDTYTKEARIQQLMAQNLVELLVMFQTSFKRVFEFGAGLGGLTSIVCKHITFQSYIANDIFDYGKRVSPCIEWRFFDMANLSTQDIKKCDLVLSNACVQWLSFHKLLDDLKYILSPRAFIAFSSFGVNNLIEVRDMTGLGLDYLNLADIRAMLGCNFEILHLSTHCHKLQFNRAIDVFRHLKHSGVNAFKPIYLSKAMLRDYSNKFHNALTYQPIYIIARLKHSD